jgi:hypothetical protein
MIQQELQAAWMWIARILGHVFRVIVNAAGHEITQQRVRFFEEVVGCPIWRLGRCLHMGPPGGAAFERLDEKTDPALAWRIYRIAIKPDLP